VIWVRDEAARARSSRIAAQVASPTSPPSTAAAATGVIGAKLSEHIKGNALDIRALKLSDGKGWSSPTRWSRRTFAMACDERLRAVYHRAGSGLRWLSRGPCAC